MDERSGQRGRWGAWLLAVYAIGSLAAVVGLAETDHPLPHPSPPWPLIVVALGALAATATLLLVRLPGHGVTRVLVVLTVAQLTGAWLHLVAQHSSGVTHAVFERVAGVVWVGQIPLLAVLILLFPTGRPPGPRWVPVLRVQLAALGLAVAAALIGIEYGPVQVMAVAAGLVLLATTGVAVISLVVRWRRAEPRDRDGMRVFVVAAVTLVSWYAVTVGLTKAGVPSSISDAVFFALSTGLPVAIGYGALRHRLYGVDVVVRRAAVWSVLSAGLFVGYLAVAAIIDAVVGASRAATVVAAATIVVVLAPLSRLVQAAIDRLLYGRRGDPAEVLRIAARTLASAGASGEVPQRLAGLVVATLRLPWACVELDREGQWEQVAAAGARDPSGPAPALIPLTTAGEEPARLLVQPRRGELSLTRADRRLLDELAAQVAPTLLSVRFVDELERSRQRLLLARRDEREHLRRDLHDTLSPALNGVRLAVTAAHRLLREDPTRAEALLETVRCETEQTGESIRRMLARLQPAALDDGDVVAAVTEHADQVALAGGLAVEVRADHPLPPLPRQVAEAVYRIAVEAVTNAARHASAEHCIVHIAAREQVTLEVSDDGHGLAAGTRPGMGWDSMSARAAEVGGHCEVSSPAVGGTRVVAVLPLAGLT